MYSVDLSPLRYSNDAFDAANWACPLLSVGWIEHLYPFVKGKVPSELSCKLFAMLEQTDRRFMNNHFRGLHECSICASEGCKPALLEKSYRNLFVPGVNAVYAAPGGITHYIERHMYAPPQEFIEAVMKCPALTTPEYLEALRGANHNVEPPLEDDETINRKSRERRKAIVRD